MPDAVVVEDAYKIFGKPAEPFWRRTLHRNGVNGSASNGNPNTLQELPAAASGQTAAVEVPVSKGHKPVEDKIIILTRLGLKQRDFYHPMEEMSRGMQQKVAIARALLSHPRLLLLDEPTTGLDPCSNREVQAVIRELRTDFGTTILLTTHDMTEAETLCERIAIMDSGRVVALDTPGNLKKGFPEKDGRPVTLEDVFLELTGKQLKNIDEEE